MEAYGGFPLKKLKIVLLNPPGDQIYIRDYYCSKLSKAHYLYHPVDLLMLSGTLNSKHEIHVIDGMIEGASTASVEAEILRIQPQIIIFLTGVISFIPDFEFLRRIKDKLSFLTVASGELFLENPGERLTEYPFLDGAILDFTSLDILTLLDRFTPRPGFAAGDPIPNIVYRSGETIIEGPAVRGKGEYFELDLPQHARFPNQHYRYPFVRRFPFATVLTDFGCPYHCRFCAISKLGFKIRTVENVLQELDEVKRLGFRDIYFDDQTFGANRARTEELLEQMIQRRYNLGFICFTRADVVDRELLKLMKQAGCHTVVFGVESQSDTALKKVGKGLTGSRIREAISWCKTLKIRTVGTFVIGLPGMTVEEADTIGDFAIDLGLDFASFNVPVPRPGTNLREMAIQNKWIKDELQPMDQSGSFAVMGNEFMTAEQALHFRNKASRRFYLRFTYLIKRLFAIRTLYELESHLKEMSNLIHPRIFVKKH